ncbi:MAG: hypothetical protein ACJ71O_11000 [Nitrososphaeraceae archaeon]
MHHSNKTEALNQPLLQITRKSNNNNTNIIGIRGKKSKDYDDNIPSPLFYLSINNPCKDIVQIGANAEEYYHVELICQDNGIEYGIQAYGEEAKELYKEINGFTIAGCRLVYKEVEELLGNNDLYQEEKEQEKLKLVKKAIDCITDDGFDNGCVLIFKKLKDACISKRKGYA